MHRPRGLKEVANVKQCLAQTSEVPSATTWDVVKVVHRARIKRYAPDAVSRLDAKEADKTDYEEVLPVLMVD